MSALPVISPLLTRQQAAEYLGVGIATVDRLIRSRRLPVVRLGRKCVRIRWEDLYGFVEAEAARDVP